MAEQKAQAKDERAAPAAKPEPTHDLHLANGDVIEHHGAIPTHVAIGDRVVPVVNAYER